MNESDRVELERLKAGHAQLQAQLQALTQSIGNFEQRLARAAEALPPIPELVVPPPTEVPPVIAQVEVEVTPDVEEPPQIRAAGEDWPREGFRVCKCGQCEGAIEFPQTSVGELVSCPHCGQLTRL